MLGKIWPRRFDGLEKTKLEPKFHVKRPTTSRMDPTFANLAQRLPWHFTQLNARLKNFLSGWLLVLGLKECLVECATLCVKSEVILRSKDPCCEIGPTFVNHFVLKRLNDHQSSYHLPRKYYFETFLVPYGCNIMAELC